MSETRSEFIARRVRRRFGASTGNVSPFAGVGPTTHVDMAPPTLTLSAATPSGTVHGTPRDANNLVTADPLAYRASDPTAAYVNPTTGGVTSIFPGTLTNVINVVARTAPLDDDGAPLWAFEPGATNVTELAKDSFEAYASLTDMGDGTAHPVAGRVVCDPNPTIDTGSGLNPVDPDTCALVTGVNGVGRAFQFQNTGPKQGGLVCQMSAANAGKTFLHMYAMNFPVGSPLIDGIRVKWNEFIRTDLGSLTRMQHCATDPTFPSYSPALPAGIWVWVPLEGGFTAPSGEQARGPYLHDLIGGTAYFLHSYKQATVSAGTINVVASTRVATFSGSSPTATDPGFGNGSLIKIRLVNQVFQVDSWNPTGGSGLGSCHLTLLSAANQTYPDTTGANYGSLCDGETKMWIKKNSASPWVKIIDWSPASVNHTGAGCNKPWCDIPAQASIEIANVGVQEVRMFGAETAGPTGWSVTIDNFRCVAVDRSVPV